MPATQDFDYIYDFDFTNPDSGTIYPAPTAQAITVADNVDGNNGDDQTPLSNSLEVTSGGGELPAGSVALYVGTTALGDPILEYNGQFYVLSNDAGLAGQTVGTIGTDPYLYCFAAGTLITTPDGAQAVETLAIGDIVMSAEGAKVPVKWIGRQTVSGLFGAPERLMPVRFAAGSLGNGLPEHDLTVTSDHGMLIDGVICHAGALTNGTTITQVPLSTLGDRFTVYHVETESHEIILANGAAAETFIDNVSRRAFDNFAEFDAQYGDVPAMETLPYPRAMSARQLPNSIRARVAVSASA